MAKYKLQEMPDMQNKGKKRVYPNLKPRHGILLILLLLIILFKQIPQWSICYTSFIYPHIGAVLSHISGIFPFAIGDLFIALSIAWVILYPIYQIFFKKILIRKRWLKQDTILLKKRVILGRVAEYLLWIYAWFYIAWGLNYSQPNIYYRMKMMPAKVSEKTLRDFAYRYVDSLNYLSEACRAKNYQFICKNTDSFDKLKAITCSNILKGYNELQKASTYMGINRPFNQQPHVKTMVFSRFSSMAGVTGSMGPFFCEFTLNGEVQPHDYPATYAHEFAHFLGVANEGEANFYSYVVCTQAKDKAVRFCGYYHIFFHVLANAYDILGEKEGEALLHRVRPEIIALAKSDRRYWLGKRCKAIDAAQDLIFELYLRGNNVKEGRKSYSGVIALILSWEAKKKELSLEKKKD